MDWGIDEVLTTGELISFRIEYSERHSWFATLVSILSLPETYERHYA